MKACVLKPIVWNNNQYITPSGHYSQWGFVADHGFGFEEWNNSPFMSWRDQRIFHTESVNDAEDFADGRLLMIMMANNSGTYAVGVAAGIIVNNSLDQTQITRELDFLSRADEIWSQPRVQSKFPSRMAFDQWWANNYMHVKWRCPEDLFYWFPQPQGIHAAQFKSSGALTNRYGKKDDVSRDCVASYLEGKLPKEHAIWEWLAEGDFKDVETSPLISLTNRNPFKKKRKARRGGGAVSQQISYWVEGNRTVEPHHSTLQAAYVDFLKNNKLTPEENDKHIDIQFTDHDGSRVFCEVKPTIKVKSCYAIRIAVGQLLEYRFKHDESARLRVVINYQPTDQQELAFLKSLDIDIAYMSDDQSTFHEIINSQ